MRVFKLPGLILAVGLSIMTETLVLLVLQGGAIPGGAPLGALLNGVYRLIFWFHLPGALLAHRLAEAQLISREVQTGLIISAAACQWWLIFWAALWMLRRLTQSNRRGEPNPQML